VSVVDRGSSRCRGRPFTFPILTRALPLAACAVTGGRAEEWERERKRALRVVEIVFCAEGGMALGEHLLLDRGVGEAAPPERARLWKPASEKKTACDCGAGGWR